MSHASTPDDSADPGSGTTSARASTPDRPAIRPARGPLSRPQARHLVRSRHGIWYVRWVVPADLRARFPQLPAELKRSTKTSELRVARQFSRNFLGHLQSRITPDWPDMQQLLDPRLEAIFGQMLRPSGITVTPPRGAIAEHRATGIIIDCDAQTGRITRVETRPDDPPETLAMVQRLLDAQMAIAAARVTPAILVAATHMSEAAPRGAHAPTDGGASVGNDTPANAQRAAERCIYGADGAAPAGTTDAPTRVLATAPPNPTPSRWLSDAIDEYTRHLRRKAKLSENTIVYTHAPSLRLFRELLSDSRRADQAVGASEDEAASGPWDIRLHEITPTRVGAFIETFWKFPTRQGKRPDSADAKAVLAEGGEAQSRENTAKRLRHIHALLGWLVQREDIDKSILGALTAELDGLALGRDTDHSQPLDLDDDDFDEDGYVAFSVADRKRLFHPEVYMAHSARDAARFFIPLGSRWTGARLNELAQCTVADVRTFDGIPCLSVTTSERDGDGRIVPVKQRRKRVKSKAGRRVLPLHPELIRLGFLDYVAERKATGHRALFDLKWFPKAGYGKYPGRDFRVLTEAVGVWEHKRKVFHSWRATIAQELEEVDLEDTLIDRFLGHSVNTIRARHYGRNREGRTLPLRRVFEALCKVPVDTAGLPPWSEVRGADRRQLKRLCATLDLTPLAARSGDRTGDLPPGQSDVVTVGTVGRRCSNGNGHTYPAGESR